MRIKTFTKQEVQKVYEAIEKVTSEIAGENPEEHQHIEGIIIIGFRDDNSFSETNLGQINLRNVCDAFYQILAMFTTERQEEKPKHAE